MEKCTSKVLVTLTLLSVLFTASVSGNGGSKCPGTSCAEGAPGQVCNPVYDGNQCCPVWHCRDHNGVVTTHFGVSSGSGGSVVQSVSSSFGGAPPGQNLMNNLQNMFANMFG